MMPFSYGNNRQKKRQKKKENTKTFCFGQHGFISVYRVNCGKYDTLCNKNIFPRRNVCKSYAFFMELFILVLGAGIFSAYRYIYHSLTITNMKAIIITEAVLIVGEFIIYSFCVPVLLWF